MTADYFAALATRVVHPDRGIQPRRRTIFDAPAATARAGALPQTATEVSNDDAEVGPGYPVRPSQGPLGVERTISYEGLAAHGDFLEQRAPVGAVDEVAFAFQGAARAEATSAAAHRGRSDEAGGERPIREHPLPAAAAEPALPPGPIAARFAASALVPAAGADRARQGVDVVPHVRRAGDANAPEAARPSRAAGDSEPVIRVHIGRVDVRAVLQAPASPPAPRDAKPGLMSLDDYVRQRREARP